MFNWIKPKTSEVPSAAQQNDQPKSKKDQLIDEAMGHAKNAREAIGEETLAKVRDLMHKQQQAQKPPEQRAQEALKSLAPSAVESKEVSPMEQAKKILLSMDADKLSDHLRLLREEDKKFH